MPKQAPYHWKRGISLYYAERYADGVRQFDLHQTVNATDVENAVWRFLCMTRAPGVGFKRAQREILPIQGDSRVPMKQIHRLYQGNGTIDEVFEAARSGDPSPQALKERLFYAHLYVGLYRESAGNPKSARLHIKQAGDDYRIEDYMGDVARVHLKLRQGESEKKD